MIAGQKLVKKPWHKEPYVWLIIFFPSLAVVAGIYTIILAIQSNDGLVVDDYYKQGLEINQTLERDYVAQRYGLQSAIQLNRENLMLQVNIMQENKDYQLPATIGLSFNHRTRNGFDQNITLTRQEGNVYQGKLDKALDAGWWTVQMEADDWRLIGKMRHTMGELWLSPPVLPKKNEP